MSAGITLDYADSRDEKRESRMNSALLSGIHVTGAGKIFVGGGVTRGMSVEGKSRSDYAGSVVYPLAFHNRLRMAQNLLRAAATRLAADYGFFFVRDEWALPSGYAHGLNATLAWREDKSGEQDEISQWSRVRRSGYWLEANPRLRDLYEVNLLSERHLGRRLGAGTLGDWIRADASRGELEAIGEGRHIWTLSDEQMQDARPLMIEAGVIVARCERVWRKEPPEETSPSKAS